MQAALLETLVANSTHQSVEFAVFDSSAALPSARKDLLPRLPERATHSSNARKNNTDSSPEGRSSADQSHCAEIRIARFPSPPVSSSILSLAISHGNRPL